MGEPLKRGDVTGIKEYVQLADEAIKKHMNKAHTEHVKRLEKEIKIKRIKNMPFTYAITQEFFETRELEACQEPSGPVASTADHVLLAAEYQKWDLDCPKPVKDYEASEKDIILKDSIYHKTCDCCSGGGKVPCTCNNGIVYCEACEGEGKVQCTFCYGSGTKECPTCGGRGRIKYNDGSEGPCNNCTWGKAPCGYCYNGYVRCRSCGGEGAFTCGRCGGSTWATCKDCEGLGGIKHFIRVHQKFNVAESYSIIDGYHVDRNTYGYGRLSFFTEPHKDTLLSVREGLFSFVGNSRKSIASLLGYDVPDYTPNQNWISKERPSGKTRKAKEMVYQRNVLEIEYEFNQKPYKMLYDATSERCLMDEDPYKVEEKQIKEDWVAVDEEEAYFAKQEREAELKEERKAFLENSVAKKQLNEKAADIGKKSMSTCIWLGLAYGCLVGSALNGNIIAAVILLVVASFFRNRLREKVLEYRILEAAHWQLIEEYSYYFWHVSPVWKYFHKIPWGMSASFAIGLLLSLVSAGFTWKAVIWRAVFIGIFTIFNKERWKGFLEETKEVFDGKSSEVQETVKEYRKLLRDYKDIR